MSAGRVADAEQACREVVEETATPRPRRVAGPVSVWRCSRADGRPQVSAELEHASAASPVLDPSGRARALGWVSIAHLWLGDLDGASRAAHEAAERPTGSPPTS